MDTREISQGIHAITSYDRRSALFEGLWPVQSEGVTYNSYFIDDEKKVLVDLAGKADADGLVKAAAGLVDLKSLDYVVMNHMEPDHSGALRAIFDAAPRAQIICTAVATSMLESYYSIHDRIRTVEDGESLSIGKRTLVFHHTPLVHWPETMVTYDESDGILFSCDVFGGFGADEGVLFDDETKDLDGYVNESLRYYSNIIAKFAKQAGKMISRLQPLSPKMVAPAHGLIWRKDPMRIINLYQTWSDYADNGGETGVTVMYASMYGNTKRAVDEVIRGLKSESIPVYAYDVATTHLSYILASLWSNHGVVVACPTYEGAIFPTIRHVLVDAGAKRMFHKKVAYFGSWSWSSGALREVKSLVEPFSWSLSDSLEFEGAAKDDVLKRAFELAVAFARRVKARGNYPVVALPGAYRRITTSLHHRVVTSKNPNNQRRSTDDFRNSLGYSGQRRHRRTVRRKLESGSRVQPCRKCVPHRRKG